MHQKRLSSSARIPGAGYGHRAPRVQHSPARRPSLHRIRSTTDDAPRVLGDWREFRASLIAQTVGNQWRSRVCEDNLRLLQIENPRLAAEEFWAHPTGKPEKGGILVSTPHAHEILRDDQFWQVVILLVHHDSKGTMGYFLNRPSQYNMGRGEHGLPVPVQSSRGALDIQEVFADSRLYCGGQYSQKLVHMLHGQSHLEGAVELVPGLYTGGEIAACREVTANNCTQEDFRFFSGVALWQPGELERQLTAGCWYPAACSRAMVLKQCLRLPVPLWREVMELMGPSYREVARDTYRNDGLF